MNSVLVFIIGVVVGGFVVRFFGGRDKMSGEGKGENLIEKQAEEKRRNKEAILAAFTKVSASQRGLSNNDVEKMLGISDATATRYFDELEKEGKVKQVGKTGNAVYYEKV